MALVLSTHPLHPRATALLQSAATFKVAESLAPENLIERAREADIIIVRAPLPPTLFTQAPRLRAAIRHGAGLDMIPMEAASAAGVLVANVPGVNARSVAEYVMFSALALARGFLAVDRDLRTKTWNEARSHADNAVEISGKTLGLIGMGNIGKQLHQLARAFDMRIVVYKPSAAGLPEDVKLEPLDTVLAEADFLVLCCPLTEATQGLIDYQRLARMKPSAFLVNVARGPIVVEADLVRALDAKLIAGAALDVFAQQPLPRDHAFFGRSNVLLTPHMAGITAQSMEKMGVGAAREALRVLNGELPINLVNPQALAAYRTRFAL